MPKTIIKKKGWRCLRCGHEWIPKEGFNKKEKPITCPNKTCRSPYWDIKKKNNDTKLGRTNNGR